MAELWKTKVGVLSLPSSPPQKKKQTKEKTTDLIAPEEDVLVVEDGGNLLEKLCEKGVGGGFGRIHRVLARTVQDHDLGLTLLPIPMPWHVKLWHDSDGPRLGLCRDLHQSKMHRSA